VQASAFHSIELEAWSQRASLYDPLFAGISTQAIPYFLNGIADWPGKRHLDVACGTGHLVAATAKQGALSEGVDFAQPMVEQARANYPSRGFEVADAAQLPHDDSTFDVVTCAFGLPHMATPQAACSEAYRVLKPGGCFAFTLWFGAKDGGEFHAIVESALGAHGASTSMLPGAWTAFRFAGQADCAALVRQSGFNWPTFEMLPIVGRFTAAEALVEMVDKLSVRSAAVIQAQPEPVRQRIYQQIVAEAEARRRHGIIELAWPALLTVAQKPI
jgi:ubiquinone/menaquinone biosynthesis C-methylase UbiE